MTNEATIPSGSSFEDFLEEDGHFVEKIRRVGFGPLVLDVEPGQVRELTSEEVLALQRAARGIRTVSKTRPGVSVAPPRRKSFKPRPPATSEPSSGKLLRGAGPVRKRK